MELFKMGRIFDLVFVIEYISSFDFVDFFNFFITVFLFFYMLFG